MTSDATPDSGAGAEADGPAYDLRLYVAGQSPRSVPTLVRKLPEPIRRITGDLSDTDRFLVGPQVRPPLDKSTS